MKLIRNSCHWGWHGGWCRGRERALAALLCLGFFLVPHRLAAHASLIHSQPNAGARLDQPPSRIMLVFNERIESVFHALRVVDSQGREVEVGETRVMDGGETLMVPLPVMNSGPYGVYWRINSLDGHQVQGQFGFGIQSEPPTEKNLVEWTPVTAQSLPAWIFPLVKGSSLLTLAVWLGGLAAWMLIFSPGQGNFSGLSRTLVLASAATYLLLELWAILARTAVFLGGSIGSALAWAPLHAVLTSSSFGQWWSARFALALILLALTVMAVKSHSLRAGPHAWIAYLCGALSAGLLATIAATGHAQAAGEWTVLAQVVQWIHLCASTLWVGGLIHLVVAVAEADIADSETLRGLSGIVERFSRVAQICVVALILTGVFNTWLHVPAWSSFIETGYGRVLAIKIVWVGITLCVAFLNWKKVVPELLRIKQGLSNALHWVPRLEPLLQAEIAGGLVILGAVALLTNMPPASAAGQGGTLELRQQAGDYTVSLRLDPAQMGRNMAWITLLDGEGAVRSDAKRLTVYLRSLEMDMGLTTAMATVQPDGSYQAEVVLTMAGRWSITVEVAPADGDSFVAEFRAGI